LPRLAPHLQHDGTHSIAGQRVGCRPQRVVDVGSVDADEKARIKTELGKPVHRDGACFNFREILPDPDYRPPAGHTPCKPCDKAGRRSALPACIRKHLVYGTQSEPALQVCVGLDVSERHLARRMRRAMRLDAFDATAQGGKRARGADLTFAIRLTAIS
jgi:hypothetical protein